MSQKTFVKTLLAASIATALTGCLSENNPSATSGAENNQDTAALQTASSEVMNGLYVTRSTGASPECPNGGKEVKSGIDENKTGILDEGEYTTQLICNGKDGIDAVSPTIAVQAATALQCPNSPADNLARIFHKKG